MALNTKKSISITGESKINGQQVIYLNADVTTDSAGNTNINQSITDQNLYRQNRVECRKDVDDFQERVWAIEDELLNEVEEQA
ncbi:hypothetical protein ACK4CS_18835 [Enterococcus gallinarum]|jgi:hypothetical protein|uniref:Prophage protein n=1 Tax=Enterococcus gallinarum TaxID=1353 RepID=A0AAE4HQ12_ENTGA|nr:MULTISPECIES: hypothetical protein [Enterococcus]MBM6740868.1 hypothetical protein [Enterococcus gallinarum]MBO6420221.1 hypothetical protein [Enterococcus gallinarum]MBO6423625.1 hypothetical protein [Enterococcus gallinarum]MCO5531685.1 hypothetical protein [Enterococcus faecium]MDT2686287.1 hypothetical protein [Enterococcus gallinarum]